MVGDEPGNRPQRRAGVLLGGALGNLTDRLARSPDRCAAGWWICGGALIVLLTLLGLHPTATGNAGAAAGRPARNRPAEPYPLSPGAG